MSALNLRHFFVTFLFVVCVWATKNSDEVREFIYDNRDDKKILNEEPAPPWVSSPNVRGTGDIIISCLVTLTACAYTSIHPIVPPRRSGKRSFMFIKAMMVFSAVLCPEAVFSFAFQEYLDARRLKKKLKEIIKAKEKDNLCGERKKCEILAMVDMKFCYFVVMGGLEVDISDIKPSDYVRFYFHGDNMPETLPLSADGVIELAMLGFLDKLLVEHTVIEDKSKGALVQKCLVLVQVAWMGIQCIARKAAGYPVSLLELHTFGHVLFAMLLYLCWLRKPLDVQQPVYVRHTEFKDERATERFQDALALMVQEQFCDLQNLTGFLNLEWKREHQDARSVLDEEDGRNPVKQEESCIVISEICHGSMPQPTPANQPQQFIESEQSTADSQDSLLWVSIGDVDSEQLLLGDPETFDLGVNQQLPCGFGHMPVSQQPNLRCIWNGADNWRVDLRKAYRSDRRKEDNLPIRLTRADRCRAERAVRHIRVVERLYNIESVEQPEPYSYRRWGPTGQHYRYLNLGYKTGFQSLTWEIEKFNPLAAKRKDKNQHIGDGEQPKPTTIDVHRKALFEESAPRVIVRYAAFIDAAFNSIGGVSKFVCVIVSAFIGAIHLAAWDSVFPTRVERVIWRIASLLMIVTVPVGLCWRLYVVLLQRYHFQYHRQGYQTTYPWFSRLLCISSFFLAVMYLLFFIIVRGYIMVESFISIRHTAYGIYFVPDWLQIFPHI